MFTFKSSTVLLALVASTVAIPMPDAGAKPFTKKNGQDAITLDTKFKSLTADSPCISGEDACIGDKFAQCANGKFVVTTCAEGTICAALPLVNKAGTSVTCTTQADKDARIAATGATGNGASAAPAAPAPAASLAASPAGPTPSGAASGAKPFTLSNGKKAQDLNAQFRALTPSSPCAAGQNACINHKFAQCVNGKFVMTPCGSGLECLALPLVNLPGTSITCDTEENAIQRIKNTGATGGLTGN